MRPAITAPDPAFRADVLAGLATRPKAIPARWFYDAAGSALFEDITRLPEYYPTRAEADLLARHGAAIAEAAGRGASLVELGSGASLKTDAVLRATDAAAYVPVDISGEFLRASAAALNARFPALPVYPVEADFTRPFALPAAVRPPYLGFFPGSTIGNFAPGPAVDLLRSLHALLGVGSRLIIGMDRAKDARVLEAAYDDAAGVTAAFNLNLAARINRELAGDLPLDALEHRAVWNAAQGRVEMHLVAARPIAFTVAGEPFSMAAGETIHTENSHKYTPEAARLLLAAGGWRVLAEWDDSDPAFAVLVAEAVGLQAAP